MTDRGGSAATASTGGTESLQSSSRVDGVDVDAVVAAVRACPSVAGMAVDGLGGAMTLLPHRRVPGIRVNADEVRLEVRARWGTTPGMLLREVRTAISPLLLGRQFHVMIADIEGPEAGVSPRALPAAPTDTAPSSVPSDLESDLPHL